MDTLEHNLSKYLVAITNLLYKTTVHLLQILDVNVFNLNQNGMLSIFENNLPKYLNKFVSLFKQCERMLYFGYKDVIGCNC